MKKYRLVIPDPVQTPTNIKQFGSTFKNGLQGIRWKSKDDHNVDNGNL